MYYSLLDAGGAFLLYIVLIGGLLFLTLAILIEAVIMVRMKLIPHFKKAFFHSFLVNLATIVLGYLLIGIGGDLFFDYIWLTLLLCFGLTVLAEAWLLKLLNKERTFKEILRVSFFMNIASYVLLTIMVYFNR